MMLVCELSIDLSCVFFSSSLTLLNQCMWKSHTKQKTNSRDGDLLSKVSVVANTRKVNRMAFVMKSKASFGNISVISKRLWVNDVKKKKKQKTVISIEELVFILRSWHLQQNIISQWPNAIHCFASELTWIHSTSCEKIYWFFLFLLLFSTW